VREQGQVHGPQCWVTAGEVPAIILLTQHVSITQPLQSRTIGLCDIAAGCECQQVSRSNARLPPRYPSKIVPFITGQDEDLIRNSFWHGVDHERKLDREHVPATPELVVDPQTNDVLASSKHLTALIKCPVAKGRPEHPLGSCHIHIGRQFLREQSLDVGLNDAKRETRYAVLEILFIKPAQLILLQFSSLRSKVR
jgi:hypothetical protein